MGSNGVTALRLVALSDVHGKWAGIIVPAGDVLIIAGDLCDDVPGERIAANEWIGSLPHRHKLYVPGNHDLGGVYDPRLFGSARVLVDELINIGGIAIYGAPWASRDRAGWERRIPPGLDVLVTHDPPYGIRDWTWPSDTRVGNADLLDAVRLARPRLHVFGHCHDGFGHEERDGIVFANVSICDRRFKAIHSPTILDVTSDAVTIPGW